ncbi:MAG: mechanosensitive ion channel [Burkholderiales bacterium]|nr:mechanosensitive ion channel [Burkholderiales bacterium]
MSGDETLFFGIRMSTLGAGILTVVLVALAHMALKWWAGRRARRDEAEAASAPAADQALRRWLASTVLAIVAPIALLLWIHGLYYALSNLLAEIPYPALTRHGLAALEGLRGVGTVLALMWLLARIGRSIESRLVAISARTEGDTDDLFLPILGKAVRLLLPLLAIILGSPALAVPEQMQSLFRNGVSMVLIGTFAYILYQLVDATAQLVLSRYRIDVQDNREARAVHTQVTVLRKVALVVIGVFTIASMLMVFESVRQLGTAILASAGVAGIVVGFAAQRSIATLLAGFQIALTQPIRIDDVVIVENEWGRIEEITLTYVVVRIWDLRRLILPITYFIEKPFQNWTRTSADILATVFLHVDHTVPLDRLRTELTRILEASQYWDRKVNVLQVTDTTEHTVQIRALGSAADASLAWNLRCEVREKLIHFLQENYPESLPRLRLMREDGRLEKELQRA